VFVPFLIRKFQKTVLCITILFTINKQKNIIMKNIKLLLTAFIILFSIVTVRSQVGIGNTDPKATLDITAANATGTTTNVDGILIPRVTRERAQSMTSTPTSTIIYINEVVTGSATATTINVTSVGFYFFNGSVWEKLGSGVSNDWSITGNTNIVDGTNFMGTGASTNVDVAFKRNNAPAGKIGATSTSFGVGALTSGASTNSTAIGNNALSVSTGNNNVAVGQNALQNCNTTAQWNTAVGVDALKGINSNAAQHNTALGWQAISLGTGNFSNNTGIGSQALQNSNAQNNTAVGYSALAGTAGINTGANNTAIGLNALKEHNTGDTNTAIGSEALSLSQGGSNNVAIGSNSLKGAGVTSTGSSNTAIGFDSGKSFTSGASNVFVGQSAGSATTTGSANVFIGNAAGSAEAGATSNKLYISNSNTDAVNSLIYGDFTSVPKILRTNSQFQIGDPSGTGYVFPTARGTNGQTLVSNGSGVLSWAASAAVTNWTILGNAGTVATTNFIGTTDNVDVAFRRSNASAGKIGTTNTSFGLNTYNSFASSNITCFGANAGSALTGQDNTAIGANALDGISSGASRQNTAVGVDALTATTGSTITNCTAVGYKAGANVTSIDNTAIGNNALLGSAGSEKNTCVGASSMEQQSGGFNTAVGFRALFNGNATGNVAVGNLAGEFHGTGSTCTMIGYQASASGLSNSTSIGNGSNSIASNQVTLGNGSIATLRCQVTSITALSDRRDKADIIQLSEGIDFIKQLKPVSYSWNTRDKSKVGIKATGFIAQDLLELQKKSSIGENLDLVDDENPDRLEARYANLLPIMVRGIQEQQQQIEELKQANAELTKINSEILKRLEALEKKGK
jgi:hypothetical protein